VWEGDTGDLIGFALHYPMYAGFNLQVHPGHRGGTLEERMLARTERRARRLARQEGHAGAIDAWDVFEEDADRVALLTRRGFARRSDNVYYLAARSLNASIPAPAPPRRVLDPRPGRRRRCGRAGRPQTGRDDGALQGVHAHTRLRVGAGLGR
jgi:hypothetical protein